MLHYLFIEICKQKTAIINIKRQHRVNNCILKTQFVKAVFHFVRIQMSVLSKNVYCVLRLWTGDESCHNITNRFSIFSQKITRFLLLIQNGLYSALILTDTHLSFSINDNDMNMVYWKSSYATYYTCSIKPMQCYTI